MKIDKFVLIGFDVVRAFYNQSGTIRRHLLCALHKRPLQFIRSPESSRHIIHENHGRFFRLAHSEKFAQGMRYPFPKSDGIRHIFLFFDGFRKSRHCFDCLLQGTPASDILRRCKTSCFIYNRRLSNVSYTDAR